MLKIGQEAFAVEFILRVRSKDYGIGGRKLWHMYAREFKGNAPLGRDRFEAVVDKFGLKIRTKKRVPRTTDSRHGLPLYPNLIKTFVPTAPYQLWVSDITYIPIWITDEDYEFCFLSLIMDGYTHEIMGYQAGATLEAYYCMIALQKHLTNVTVEMPTFLILFIIQTEVFNMQVQIMSKCFPQEKSP